jgi:hypothetical protein
VPILTSVYSDETILLMSKLLKAYKRLANVREGFTDGGAPLDSRRPTPTKAAAPAPHVSIGILAPNSPAKRGTTITCNQNNINVVGTLIGTPPYCMHPVRRLLEIVGI